MSEKISEYPITATTLEVTSLLDISQDLGGSFQSQKLPIQLLFDTFGNGNLYTTDGTLTENRVLIGGAYDLTFTKLGSYKTDALDITFTASSGNLTLVTAEDTALVLPKSADPDANVLIPEDGMIKYKTDGEHDLRAYVNGTWVSLLGGGVASSNKYSADIVFVGGTTQTITHGLVGLTTGRDITYNFVDDATGLAISPDTIGNFNTSGFDVTFSNNKTVTVTVMG